MANVHFKCLQKQSSHLWQIRIPNVYKNNHLPQDESGQVANVMPEQNTIASVILVRFQLLAYQKES